MSCLVSFSIIGHYLHVGVRVDVFLDSDDIVSKDSMS